MRVAFIVPLILSVVLAEPNGCVTDPDVPNSCQGTSLLGDATSLLQQRHVKVAESAKGEITGAINYVAMSTKYDLKCLEHNVADDNVYMTGCSGEKNQLWYFKDGYLKTAYDDDKCLDYKDDDGGKCGPMLKCNAFMNSCSSTNSQKWYWDGRYDQKEVLKTRNSNDLVLDYDYNSNHVKGNVRMYRNQFGRGQTWTMTNQHDPDACPTTYGQQLLKPKNDDKCLNAVIESDKDVDLQTCRGKTPQLWATLSGEGQLKLGDGNCLEKDPNSDHAFKHECDSSDNKIWKYDNGLLKAKWANPAFSECLENKHGEKGVRVRRCHGGPSQQWNFADSPQCVTPVDCTLSDWTSWSACSAACGAGTRTRSRTVAVQAEHDGKCEGALEESKDCKEKECPVDCTLGDWKPWSACSATCGTGTKTRSRTVRVDAQYGGKCQGALEDSEECKARECPVHCTVSDWSSWGACSATCGRGKRTRSRTVAVPAEHGGSCDDALQASEECKEKECPVDCTLSDWKPWSACSADCGTGTKTRSRTITLDAQHGGECQGALEESKDCKKKECPVDCTMSDWSSWGKCSTTCGRGKRIRSRTVAVKAEHGGTCDNAAEASEECKKAECPVDCLMSDWKDWSKCSATCGQATKHRARRVISDAQHGGVACGETTEVERCPELLCPQSIFTVCGSVKAAQTNKAIEGAVVKTNQPDSTCKKSSGEGTFCCENVKKGPVTVTVAHPDWTDYESPFTIAEGSVINVRLVHDKKPGEWEFVLTWEDQPNDLDTHVDFGSCKVYFGKTKCNDGGVEASLDIDNMNKVRKNDDRPETTTVTNGHKCSGDACHLWYRIKNYSKCTPSGTGISLADITKSKAKVEVWGHGRAKQTFVVDQGDGAVSADNNHCWWYVLHLDLEKGIVSPCKSPEKCNARKD